MEVATAEPRAISRRTTRPSTTITVRPLGAPEGTTYSHSPAGPRRSRPSAARNSATVMPMRTGPAPRGPTIHGSAAALGELSTAGVNGDPVGAAIAEPVGVASGRSDVGARPQAVKMSG